MRLFMLGTSVCSHKLLWALAQLIKLCELLQWCTSRSRGKQVYRSAWSREKLALCKIINLQPPPAKYCMQIQFLHFITLQCNSASIFNVLTYTAATSHVAEHSDENKVRQVVVVHSAMPLELMDSFTFDASAVMFLDGLKPYYCNKFSFETFDVISV